MQRRKVSLTNEETYSKDNPLHYSKEDIRRELVRISDFRKIVNNCIHLAHGDTEENHAIYKIYILTYNHKFSKDLNIRESYKYYVNCSDREFFILQSDYVRQNGLFSDNMT